MKTARSTIFSATPFLIIGVALSASPASADHEALLDFDATGRTHQSVSVDAGTRLEFTKYTEGLDEVVEGNADVLDIGTLTRYTIPDGTSECRTPVFTEDGDYAFVFLSRSNPAIHYVFVSEEDDPPAPNCEVH